MPGLLDESAEIFRYLAQLSPDTFVNIMGQYRPAHLVGRRSSQGQDVYADIDRRTTAGEMTEAYRLAREVGLRRFAR
jgi:uncharacterized Fe-S radical SAM superfamily protein PflX